MPSPFPGMDPYLEHPAIWTTVHPLLATYAGEALNNLLPPHYVARVGERVYVVEPERSIYPDVAVFRHRLPEPAASAGGGTAVAAPADLPWVLSALPMEIHEYFIEIVPVADQSRVVTVIEVLSPSNKTLGHEGRELYLAKQREVLHSDVHLLEIDLLRRGEHTVAAQRELLRTKGPWDYLICLHRGRAEYCEIWPARLRQPLPRVAVPLGGEDPDVVLDLQAVITRCYDAGAYARTLDYRRDPDPPLTPEDAAWADALLRERGLR